MGRKNKRLRSIQINRKMKRKISFLIAALLMLLSAKTATSQELPNGKPLKYLDYPTFIALVGKNNLAYAAEKFNIALAEANLLSESVFPDPELNIGYADNGQRSLNMGYGFSTELSWTAELGGKRRARMQVAKNEKEISKLLLEDYFRNLRADASITYLSAVQNQQVLRVLMNSYKQMRRLADADSVRSQLGVISEIDAMQSKLEAGNMRNEVYAAQAAWESSLADMALLIGMNPNDTVVYPKEELAKKQETAALPLLMQTALEQRADLQAALRNKQLAESLIKLAKANRAIDLGLSIGLEQNSYVRNAIAPTPSHRVLSFGVSMPLKFSNNRPGELRAAKYTAAQIDLQYSDAELQIKTEVSQAYYNLRAAERQIRQFDEGLLEKAKEILAGKTYSYQRGETSLLELLDAQRTYNETQQSYYETLYMQRTALVELERTTGAQNINF
ncbi:MAG: TolC family protein [Sphingobacterium hotanense]